MLDRYYNSAIRSSAQPLGIRDARERKVLRQCVKRLEGRIEQLRFLAKRSAAIFGQSGNQVLDHGAQAPGNLKVFRSIVANLAASEMYEVFPVRREENDAQHTGFVPDCVLAQMPQAHRAQEPMELI